MPMYERPEIVYQDENLVLLDKPSGVLVHRNPYDKQSPTCLDFLAGKLSQRIHTVHRIDRATSGLVLFALNQATARELAEQFRTHQVSKRYIAIVRGHLTQAQTVDRPVKRDVKGPNVSARSYVKPLSWTKVDVPVGRYDEAWYSLVEIYLETGRYHQARKHLHHLTHPIVGDKRHGDRAQNQFFAERFGVEHLFLRAHRLEFDHPWKGTQISAIAGIPSLWQRVADDIGLELPQRLSEEAVTSS